MNRIAELRKAAGLSQTDLANMLGISQNTLSQYENELRRPSSRVITELSDYFNVTPNYILCIPEPPQADKKDASLFEVTLIKRLTNEDDVNAFLRLGWKLLYVGQGMSFSDYDGSGYAEVIYTLGWFGDPDEAKAAPIELQDFADMYPDLL